MKDWLALHLRLTMFVSGELSLDSLWSLISPEPPEVDESRPRESIRRLVVTNDDAQLELQSLPGRIDFIMGSVSVPGVPLAINLGKVDEQLKIFTSFAKAILDGANLEITRLAFGLVLHRPVADRTAGYKELSKLTSLQLDPVKSKEFMLQINYPSQFQIDDQQIELNRLTKWSSAVMKRYSLIVNSENVSAVTPTLLDENFVLLEIDNSSPMERQDAFSKNSLNAILDKLVELAIESSNGIVV